MNESENISKLFFETLYPGSRMVYNTAQSHGEHDFNWHRNDGTITAMEITACKDEQAASTIAAIYNRKRGGPSRIATKCKQSWLVFVASGTSIANLWKSIDERLSVLESAGVECFFLHDPYHECVQNLVRELGVVSAAVIVSEGSPRIEITLTASGGAVGAITPIELGEFEARKADNRRKLAAANTKERALCVYIDPLSGGPWLAMTEFKPPLSHASLPAEMTQLWLIAPTCNHVNEFVWWHSSCDQPWHVGRMVCATNPGALGQ